VFFSFVPKYSLALRALCYRRLIRADVPSRVSGGIHSNPHFLVTVLPSQLLIHILHHYRSGHAEFTDDDLVPVLTPAAEVLKPDILEAATGIQAQPERWAPEVLFACFVPHHGNRPNRAPLDLADHFELGASVTQDGRGPRLTLRLGRQHDEIVLDHGFRWPAKERTIEVLHRLSPPATPDALATIEEAFGADMARVATWFHAERDRRFP
jgi:hypothetical protein